MINLISPSGSVDDHHDLFSAIEQIDLRLQQYTQQRRPALKQHVLEEFLLDEEDILHHTAQPKGMPHWMQTSSFMPVSELSINSSQGRLSTLIERFKLTDSEVNILLLGLLTHLDSRYHALFAALQHFEDRNNPSIELALHLFGAAADELLTRQGDFLPDSTLLRHELIKVYKSNKQKGEGWAQSLFQTTTEVFHYLVGHASLTPLLADCAKWHPMNSNQGLCPSNVRDGLQAQLYNQQDNLLPIVLLKGAQGSGRLEAVNAAASAQNIMLLELDVTKLPESRHDAKTTLNQALREVRMRGAILVVRGWDEFADSRKTLLSDWADMVHQSHVRIVGLCEQDCARVVIPHMPQIALTMPILSYLEKQLLLQQSLTAGEYAPTDISHVCRRFSFNHASLPHILQEARCYRSLREPNSMVSSEDLNQAFRLHSQKNFGKLAQRIEPMRSFEELIVADELKEQLQELLAATSQRDKVLESGFAKKVGYGTGVSALFHGDSGLGKTMAAEVVAGLLGVDLIKVDLANVVDKYIGETAKHLARIFDLAEADAGVLFFDEADALFGKRSEVSDSKDRNANIDVAYLLQRLERYPGLVILATNNRNHLDEAFSRRFTFITRFNAPDTNTREALWQSVWPEGCQLDPKIDLHAIAARTRLTGANIRNIALLAAYFAADADTPYICEHHIHRATQRELSKIGRIAL